MGAASLIAALIAATALATRLRNANRVILFWIAFVLTRPFGATFGETVLRGMRAAPALR